MRYSLTVTLNYPNVFEREAKFSRLTQRQMFEIAQDYLNDPELTSAIFVVAVIKEEPNA
jgi:hypothetical protein